MFHRVSQHSVISGYVSVPLDPLTKFFQDLCSCIWPWMMEAILGGYFSVLSASSQIMAEFWTHQDRIINGVYSLNLQNMNGLDIVHVDIT